MRHATVADHPWIERHPGASQMQQSLGHERAGDVAIDTDRIALPTVAGSSAIDGAFRDHHGWLVRRLTLVVGDPVEAEDLAQQVFLRVLEHRPDMEGRPIRPWLAAVGITSRSASGGVGSAGLSTARRAPAAVGHRERPGPLAVPLEAETGSPRRPAPDGGRWLHAGRGCRRLRRATWHGCELALRARQQLRPTLMVVDDVS